jgi:hypothetical protein
MTVVCSGNRWEAALWRERPGYLQNCVRFRQGIERGYRSENVLFILTSIYPVYVYHRPTKRPCLTKLILWPAAGMCGCLGTYHMVKGPGRLHFTLREPDAGLSVWGNWPLWKTIALTLSGWHVPQDFVIPCFRVWGGGGHYWEWRKTQIPTHTKLLVMTMCCLLSLTVRTITLVELLTFVCNFCWRFVQPLSVFLAVSSEEDHWAGDAPNVFWGF